MKRSLMFDFVFVYMHVLETSLEQKGALYLEQTCVGSFFFPYILYLWLPTQLLKVLVEIESQVFLFHELDIKM